MKAEAIVSRETFNEDLNNFLKILSTLKKMKHILIINVSILHLDYIQEL